MANLTKRGGSVGKRNSSSAAKVAEVEPEQPISPSVSLKTEDGGDEIPELKPNMKAPEFWRATAAYPERTATYYTLYRLWPKIDRRLVGIKEAWIDKAAELDEKTILRKWGSGDYQVYFNDQNRPKGHQLLAKTILELHHDDLPPVVPQEEVVIGYEKNRGYIDGLKARGKWKEAGEMDKGDNASVTAEVIGFAKDVLERSKSPGQPPGQQEAIGLVADGFKTILKHQSNPLETLKLAKDLLQPASSGDDKLLIAILTKSMETQSAMMLKLMDRDQPAAAASSRSVLDEVDQVLKIADRLGGRGRGGEGWSSFLTSLPAVINGVGNLVHGFASIRNGSPVPAAAGVGTAGLPMTVNQPAAGGDQADSMAHLQQKLAQIGQQAISAFQRGVSGSQFAESLETMEGDYIYGLIAGMGKEGIMMALQNAPGVAQQIAPRLAEVELWIADFISYGGGEGQ